MKYNYFRANYEEIRNDLLLVNWDSLLISNNVEENWMLFKSELSKAKQKIKTCRVRKQTKSKWVTRNVIKCSRAKRKAWDKYVKSGKLPHLYESYKEKLKIAQTANKRAVSF